MVRPRIACVGLALATMWGCATGTPELRAAIAAGRFADALALYDRGARPDPRALRAIAEATLAHAAQAPDARTRDAAFGALAVGGTHARDVLERLTQADAPVVRAQALRLLARLGVTQARTVLFDHLGSPEPDVRAAAVDALDPGNDTDLGRLGALAESPSGAVRLAAVTAFMRVEVRGATRLFLVRIARGDPRADVRSAALGALARQGTGAAEAIEACLSDIDPRVRMAAIGALVRSDPARARRVLDRWLASDASPEGVEAARVFLGEGAADAADAARGHLARALASANGTLRAQAAVALSALAPSERATMAGAALSGEATRAVRLALALALGAEDARAWSAFAGLMAGDDVVAAQAACELARRRDTTATRRLLALRASKSSAVRRTVVRALGHDLGNGHDVRTALLDADVTVRIAAAAAILTAG